MKILITGATGSLGAYLTRYFSEKGHEIIASGKIDNPPSNLLKYAEYFKADIRQKINFPEADVIIHTAAVSDDNASLRDLMHTNASGTENIINATKSCKKFIHISSSSVYVPSDIVLTEEITGNMNGMKLSAYGKSKLETEKILIEKSNYESCFILRPRALYGVGDKKILPRLLKMVHGNTLQHPGKMKINVSMTEYSNMAKAVDLCLNSDKKGVNIYNVSDENPYILIDVMRKISKSLYGFELKEKEIPILIPKLMSIFHIGGISPLLIRTLTKDMALDITKIKNELGYKPESNLENSLVIISGWVKNIGGVEVLKQAENYLAWEI